jgi:hypothetical protein
MQDTMGKAALTAFLTAAVWAAPSFVVSQTMTSHDGDATMTIASPLQQQFAASAKEMASGSGSRVNKDAESLLRYGLPIKNKDVGSVTGARKRTLLIMG